MTAQVKIGYILGNGSAQNISLGFIPDHVEVHDVTDGNLIYGWWRGKVMAFTSGGATQILPGQVITGASSGVTAKLQDVLLASGTWAGGDAAGFFLYNEEDGSGDFTSENVYVPGGTNDATVTAEVENGYKIDTAVANITSNGINSYVGDSTHAAGFTAGSSVSQSGKLLRYIARRNI